jgi:hypothetical protein
VLAKVRKQQEQLHEILKVGEENVGAAPVTQLPKDQNCSEQTNGKWTIGYPMDVFWTLFTRRVRLLGLFGIFLFCLIRQLGVARQFFLRFNRVALLVFGSLKKHYIVE